MILPTVVWEIPNWAESAYLTSARPETGVFRTVIC